MPQYSGMWTLSQVSQAVKNQTWTGLPPSVVEYLVVAGGGSGGGDRGGGGGAGGLLTGYVGITPGTSYTVTVGAGGVYSGTYTQGINGSNSIFRDPVSIHVTASGGGGAGAGNGGGNAGTAGSAGGSGGGATGNSGGAKLGGPGISGQGNAGGNSVGTQTCGQGGGGAGTVGLNGTSGVQDGSNGGAGIASAISGTVTTYAGGGGGGSHGTGGGTGGVGGGGSGGNAKPGAVNSGGGGGGADNNAPSPYNGANGGSGIVIIRYPGTTQFFTGGTLSYANGYIIHTFYANGTLVPIAGTLYANPDYQIARSLRFNQNDAAYLNRTFSVAGNRKTWTQSLWVKRSSLGTQQDLYSPYYGGNGSDESQAYFNSSDQLSIYDSGGAVNFFVYTTTQLFRDLSAWYHIVFACDTTQSIASDRMKIYVNGVRITSFVSEITQSQNTVTGWNDAQLHRIGSYARNTTATLDGYMAEFHNIDGLALTPSSFGWTNPATGVWSPLDYVGSYGTNGFHLNFSDNSNVTAATLGADSSGNGHNWTPNNFSVTAGIGNDSMVDTPTSYGTDTGVGGEVRGNYCTVNAVTKTTNMTLTNGNLDCVSSDSDWSQALGTIGMSSGKWYFEVTKVNAGGGALIGIAGSSVVYSTSTYIYQSPVGYLYYQTGQKYNNNVDSAYGASYTAGDVVGVAFDADAGTLVFYKNGASQGTAFSGLTSGPYLPAILPNNTTGNLTCNFGQRPFAYTAPSGFKALCTQNLPTPTIGATSATLASEYFNTTTVAGTGLPRLIDTGMQSDFVWVKPRNVINQHLLFDVLRGPSRYFNLTSAGTGAEASDPGYYVTSFNSDGFNVGLSDIGFNGTNYTYVAWTWKGNGAGVTNTSGSITSTVSASPASGFSIVRYSGNATSGATVGHGLGVAPSMIIAKTVNDSGYNWPVYHIGLTDASYSLQLDLNLAQSQQTNKWNSTAPTSTVVTLGNHGTNVSGTNNQILYCFAPIAGYSAFGSYTGNGSTNGTFVHLGFRPAFVMIKRISSTGDWFVYNNKTAPINVVSPYLVWNSSGVEGTYTTLDFLSNGFKLRVTDAEVNGNGSTIIYMAFAENPFKYSLAR